MNYLYRYLGIGLIALLFISSSSIYTDEIKTTIVVISGKAMLVDIDDRGEVVKTYMEVPEYLTTPGTHDRKVKAAKASYLRLSKRQMDQIRFITILDKDEDYKLVMRQNLSDLAKHYNDTYANEVLVTVARGALADELIAYNVHQISTALMSHGVLEEDITVEFKVDLGEDPAPFIKVLTRFKKLTSL